MGDLSRFWLSRLGSLVLLLLRTSFPLNDLAFKYFGTDQCPDEGYPRNEPCALN